MCDKWCLEMGKKLLPYLKPTDRVLETGSRNVNGSCRESIQPYVEIYHGIDIEAGPGVDEILDACQISNKHQPGSFDCVISTEMLEHVKNWKNAISEMWKVLHTGGLLLLTTRTPGFPKHGYPSDYWRFTAADMIKIFSPAGAIIKIAYDPTLGWPCGIGAIVRKQSDFSVDHLAKINVLSVDQQGLKP